MKNIFKALKTVTLSTWIRTALMIVAVINMILEICGLNILPISDEQVSTVVTYVFTIIVFVINWWKNNSFTIAAQEADKLLRSKQEELIYSEGEE